jgi:DNA repair photolyase
MPSPSKGRGAAFNPPNRYERYHLEPLPETAYDEEEGRRVKTVLFKDLSRTILAKNDSPDVPFTYSVNPYRGCEHGCIYCYARPSHEYLGFSAGLDFESKIVVKTDAAELLDKALRRRSWKPQMVSLSGNTDCYQPLERQMRLTRRCLEVFLAHRNPVGVITKNFLVTRDLDILRELAALRLTVVALSITTLRDDIIRDMEPRTSSPRKRYQAIEALARHGIPTMVNVAPVIPGLTDEELPQILRRAAESGATFAGYQILRLPGAVKGLFAEWLERTLPQRANRILAQTSGVHGGNAADVRWGTRMKGEGAFARAVQQLFNVSCRKYGLNKSEPVYETGLFRRDGQEPEPELFQ